MEDTLSRGLPIYSPNESSSFPTGLQRFGMPSRRPPRASSSTSTRYCPQPHTTREPRATRPGLTQDQYDQLLARIVADGSAEFDRQRTEIQDLTKGVLAQAKLLSEQQEAHELVYAGAKATYDALNLLRSQVKAEIAALKGETEGQQDAVQRLTITIGEALQDQWKTLTKKLQEDTEASIDVAKVEFDTIKGDVGRLNEWAQKAIKQEQDDRIKICETNKATVESLVMRMQSLKRKLSNLKNNPIDQPTSSKRARQSEVEIGELLNLEQGTRQGTVPPLPLPQQVVAEKRKEPRNLPLPPKFDGTSSKLREFLMKVDNTFERMPLTNNTASEKILFVADLLTGGASTWYYANQHKRKPDVNSGWVEWDTFNVFKREFINVHQNPQEKWYAKVSLQKEFQKKGEQMKDFITRVRVHQLVAELPKEQLWEHLINAIQPEVRNHMVRGSTDKYVLDKVPASTEMCFQAIADANVEYERAHAQSQFRRRNTFSVGKGV